MEGRPKQLNEFSKELKESEIPRSSINKQ